MSPSSRRNFLKSASLLGGGLAFGTGALSKQVYAHAASLDLPYYKPGTPFSNELRTGSGEPLTLQGTVYQHDGKTPLAGASVEIWHCDENGLFDFSNRYLCRGKASTNHLGRYFFKTTFPGRHRENGQAKMSRIFVLVTGSGHQPSFSQLYFDSNRNPFIDARHWEACPMVQRPSLPKLSRPKQLPVVTYNHYLVSSSFFHLPTAKELAASRLKLYPGPQNKAALSFGKISPGHVAIRVIDHKGEIVRKQFFRNVQPEQPLLVADNLEAGVYTCAVFTSRFGRFTKRLGIG